MCVCLRHNRTDPRVDESEINFGKTTTASTAVTVCRRECLHVVPRCGTPPAALPRGVWDPGPRPGDLPPVCCSESSVRSVKCRCRLGRCWQGSDPVQDSVVAAIDQEFAVGRQSLLPRQTTCSLRYIAAGSNWLYKQTTTVNSVTWSAVRMDHPHPYPHPHAHPHPHPHPHHHPHHRPYGVIIRPSLWTILLKSCAHSWDPKRC